MKNTYLFLLSTLISFSMEAQTTLQYSGSATTPVALSTAKVGGIGQNNITTNTTSFHIGLLGTASNATVTNVGVFGTTVQNIGPGNYLAFYGDNFSNNISANNKYVTGGRFWSKNLGTNATITGADVYALGNNNSSTTVGVDATADNSLNTTTNKAIGIRGITSSGNSTPTNLYKDVANPGGYFSSNDGQGIYATTSDGYSNGSGGKISQAVTGYSNLTNAFSNVGVVGYSEGTGTFKVGIFGQVNGVAASFLSSAIAGTDNINAANTYAGYFEGKVYANGKMGVGVSTISTNEQMEVNGRVRIRRNAFASGLWFNNSANGTSVSDGAFVGLSNETAGAETVGFWVGGNFKFLVDRSGNTTMNGGLSVGGGQTINKIIKTSISANAGLIGTNSFSTQTYTITGVAVGDNVVVNIDGLPTNYIIASTRVSANDTVEVKYYNNGAATTGFPPLITMYVTAFK